MTTTMRHALISSLLCAAAALTATAAASDEAGNRALLSDYVACLNATDDRCLERFLPADKVPGIRKSEGLRRHYFPDLQYRVLELVAEGDRVVARLELTGRREDAAEGGEGGAAGGGRLELEEVMFYTVRDGKLHDGKLVSDRMAVAEALGYVVEPPAAP